ncbi:MAG: cell division protein FtsA [Prevotella sp.]|nr:cell division protein FtsA [Prevotella sp.]MBR1462108.1 cell division protein FtsA [Prevotella sp.]
MAAKEFIVAIELGSSKMTGIAGKKNLDGSITVLAVVKEDSSTFIRKGVIYNIDKTAQCISNIVKKLTATLKTNISHVYVGVGGQSIRSVKNNIVKNLAEDTIVTQEMVNELMDGNRAMTYQDQEILDAATQEYKVDNQYQMDPVGIQCTRLEGNFLNILWRKMFYRNLNKCFDIAGVAIADMYLAPFALADSVLTDAEKRSGCALVDLGADTTTVSVYYKNILRHLAVIPLGSNNITKDIASLQMEESAAEQMKLKYGSAWTDNGEIDNQLTLSIDSDRTVKSREFISIVESRMEEIIENVWYQVPSEYADRLLGGIILTGGGSNMKNIETAFRNHTHIEKIRIAKFVTQSITSKDPDINARNGMMNTILGLLAKGNMNCAGGEMDPAGDLFGEKKQATTTTDIHREPRKVNELDPGVVLTEAEKLKAEEERRRAEEAEEERRRAEEEAAAEAARIAAEEERRQRKENSSLKKTGNKLMKFLKGLVQEDE